MPFVKAGDTVLYRGGGVRGDVISFYYAYYVVKAGGLPSRKFAGGPMSKSIIRDAICSVNKRD